MPTDVAAKVSAKVLLFCPYRKSIDGASVQMKRFGALRRTTVVSIVDVELEVQNYLCTACGLILPFRKNEEA